MAKYNSPEDMPIISGGGFGGCSAFDCKCTAFQGSWGQICQRCNHAFKAHY